MRRSCWNILLVDDSPTIVKMVCLMLRHQGHTVSTAENGEAALQQLERQWQSQQKGYDVILMDLQMPVMDGVETTRRIRLLERDGSSYLQATHQFILAMSANSDDETMQAVLAVGADDFITKPFVLDLFVRKVTTYLAQHPLLSPPHPSLPLPSSSASVATATVASISAEKL